MNLPNLNTLKKFASIIGLVLFAYPAPAQEEETTRVIRFPYNLTGEESYAKRNIYLANLLELVIEKSGENYTLEQYPIPSIPATRNIRNMDARLYDIAWIHTDKEREKRLYPIRVPLFKGLIGWRLMFLAKQRQDIFKNVYSISDLKNFSAGLGPDWPDVQVFQHNQLKVLTSTSRESLVKMLLGERIDYFPRGLVEIWDEHDKYNDLNLVIDPYIAVVYPSAFYFFVRNEDIELGRAIEKGINMAIDDGSFNRLFYEYYGEEIKNSQLENRKIFVVNNPNFPSNQLDFDARVWFQADKLKTH